MIVCSMTMFGRIRVYGVTEFLSTDWDWLNRFHGKKRLKNWNYKPLG